MAHVLILSKSFEATGGIANFVRSVIAHLPENIRATHLAIGRSPGRERNPITWIAPLVDNVRLVVRIRKQRPDCVHVNPSFNWASLLRDGAFLFTLQLLRYEHTLVFFHGWEPRTAERVRNSRVLSWLIRCAMRKVPVVCVLAADFKRCLEGIGIPPERVHVVTTMYDPAIFEGLTRQRTAGPPVILFLGRLAEDKGGQEVLDAFALLSRRLPDARLLMAGAGPQLGALQHRSRTRGLADRVGFPGYLSGTQKGQVLLDADLLAFPTRHAEGCPVSLLEAMAAGLPVITTAVGGIPDFFRDGVNGTLLDQVEVPKLSAAMYRALTDRDWAGACGRRNQCKAHREFAPDTVVRRLVGLYRRAAAS